MFLSAGRGSRVSTWAVALILSVPCVWLAGCEGAGKATNQAAEDFKRGLLVKQRDAINAVNRELTKSFAEIDTHGSSDDPRTAVRAAYNKLIEVDRSACPPDFRNQYERVVTSFRELSDALNDIPADDDEKLAYWLKQWGSSSPDFEGKEPLRVAQGKYQNLMHEMNELKAVAHNYGAEID